MKILVGHNFYQTFGGEDAVFKAETQMLRSFGHTVITYERNNDELNAGSIFAKLKALWNLSWSERTYQEVRQLIQQNRPDVAHFHNIYFAISPSAYYACQDEGVPVVQSLHNFRLFCSNGLFYRNQQVCEDCLKKTLWQGVIHGCYKNSRFITYCVNRMLENHRHRKTWQQKINLFITASEFGKNKLVQAGLDPRKIRIKPNFLDWDPGKESVDKNFALYVGRLSEEKGLDTLIDAWKKVKDFPLKLIGQGPLEEWVKEQVNNYNLSHVQVLGFAEAEQYKRLMREASFVVVPSRCYENFPRIVAESYAFGKPVVASRLGSLAEIVEDTETGLLFTAGDGNDFAEKVNWMITHPQQRSQMGKSARQAYEKKYDARHNYELLMDIYQSAIENRI
jgi:glycosyltransferase involved in cell wall biosynthesis